jgi:hypothetical protein
MSDIWSSIQCLNSIVIVYGAAQVFEIFCICFADTYELLSKIHSVDFDSCLILCHLWNRLLQLRANNVLVETITLRRTKRDVSSRHTRLHQIWSQAALCHKNKIRTALPEINARIHAKNTSIIRYAGTCILRPASFWNNTVVSGQLKTTTTWRVQQPVAVCMICVVL